MWKILVIDDKPDNLVAVSALLKNLIPECEVLTAKSGAKGLAAAIAELPDTILLDIHMPEMDGFEVCARLKTTEQTRSIPVIMLTAVKTESRDLVKGLETGADAYLFKPIDEHVMVAQVKTALRIRDAEEKLRWHNQHLDRMVREKTRTLQETEERFRALLNATTDTAILIDTDFTVQAINRQGARRLNREVSQLVDKNILDFLPPEVAARRRAVAEEVIRTGRPASFEDEREDYIFSHRVYPVFDNQQNVVQLALFGKDITREREAEKEKKQLEERLHNAEKMEAIGSLAGGIAHDFNNILASIIGYAELAQDEPEMGETLEECLREILIAGQRARALVQQILTFARQGDDEIQPLQTSTIAKETLKLLRSSLPANIEIRSTIESQELIMGDATQIHQILMNLCTNAAQAMEEQGGLLAVSLQDVRLDENFVRQHPPLSPGDYQCLSVSDSGCGIAPAVVDAIFNPYFTTKNPGEGTGMGLSTVHGIVTRYGGVIQVDSRMGEGSTFSVYLPVIKDRNEISPQQTESIPTGQEHILVVDDEASIAEVTRRILERLGYTVTVRTSSIEALALFRARPDDFDLVLTDLTMPNMTGDVLAQEIMQLRPEIPVILCTGYSKRMSQETAEILGIRAFVYKPLVKTDLAKSIRNLLDGERRP